MHKPQSVTIVIAKQSQGGSQQSHAYIMNGPFTSPAQKHEENRLSYSLVRSAKLVALLLTQDSLHKPNLEQPYT